jgi:hypothetical protein
VLRVLLGLAFKVLLDFRDQLASREFREILDSVFRVQLAFRVQLVFKDKPALVLSVLLDLEDLRAFKVLLVRQEQ